MDNQHLDFQTYQTMALRTAGKYATSFEQLENAVYGIVGEAGEIMDLLKKHRFQGHTLDPQKFLKECGDVLWYLNLLTDYFNTDLSYVAELNIEKLKMRYPEGFDENKSIYRKESDV